MNLALLVSAMPQGHELLGQSTYIPFWGAIMIMLLILTLPFHLDGQVCASSFPIHLVTAKNK